MSYHPTLDPVCTALGDGLELEIAARTRSIGDFDVGRVLPAPARRSIGPFVFFDHMGPTQLAAGHGLDVRPHPHIHLATVTYLFEGEIMHRDSIGSAQIIRPGAINWMTAGRGIVHSERSPDETRAKGPSLHGLQLWVALPRAHEDDDPSFSHHAATSLPELDDRGVSVRVLAGEAFGERSPAPVLSPLFYADVGLERGARIDLPREHEERAAYVISGEVKCGSRTIGPRTMAVFKRGDVVLEATVAARIVLIGGAPLDGPRYIFWNFVSSSKERIQEAASDWREGRFFPLVPGDEKERIPLTDEPRFPG